MAPLMSGANLKIMNIKHVAAQKMRRKMIVDIYGL